jgi:polyisoprenoid-binding protein YceI
MCLSTINLLEAGGYMIKLIATLVLSSLLTVFAQTDIWKFDHAHTQVKFNVTHLVITEVTGYFKSFDGVVKTQGEDFTKAEIDFTIQTKSINTENEKRDNHLRSDDFFNAEKYPEIKFKSKSIKKTGNNKYKMIGDLTIRDVTKEVELDLKQGGIITDGQSKTRTGFQINGIVNRFDYNLKWNALLEAGGAVVGPNVEIVCNVELVKDSGA